MKRRYYYDFDYHYANIIDVVKSEVYIISCMSP